MGWVCGRGTDGEAAENDGFRFARPARRATMGRNREAELMLRFAFALTLVAGFVALPGVEASAKPRKCCVSVMHARSGSASTARTIALATAGHARHQAYLGYMYETGRGVPQDYALAAKWYYRAAAQGDVRGQHLLGLLYDKGFGVREDYIEAHKWSNLAAARARGRDREYFARIRDALTTKMTFGQIVEAQRRARYWHPVRER